MELLHPHPMQSLGHHGHVDHEHAGREPALAEYPLKRALDLMLSIAMLIVLSPVMLVAFVAVRLTSPGGALFRQVRIGSLGRPFVLLKFRTMVHNCSDEPHREFVQQMLAGQLEAPSDGVYKLEKDPRVTRVGALLRRSSIDELPQLFNVVRGQMSLVGPRPSLEWEVREFPVWSCARLLVRPGLTGVWQVVGRNRLTMVEGLRLDVGYIESCSLGRDLAILLRTPLALLRGGAR